MNNVELSFTTSYEDYYRLNLWHGRFGRMVAMVFYFLLFLGAVVYQTGSVEALLEPFVIGAGLLLILVLYGFFLLSLKWRSRRVYNSDKLLQQEQHFVFTNEHIAFTNATGTGSMAWDDVYKAVETKSHFLIYMGKMRSLIIPKASMSSEADISALRQLIASKLGSGKHKLRGA
ncbi:YcxB family protein [Paenibacillus sambharensis]|nr:YcxB family protein [Paenibacillus sambharensis]